MVDRSIQAIPELLEVDLLAARTETLVSFRELGPPDLCHTVKGISRSGQKDLGPYHYTSGVDVFVGVVGAYLNSLTYPIEGEPVWFLKAAAGSGSGCYWHDPQLIDSPDILASSRLLGIVRQTRRHGRRVRCMGRCSRKGRDVNRLQLSKPAGEPSLRSFTNDS